MTVTTRACAVRRAREGDADDVIRLWIAGATHHKGLAGYADDVSSTALKGEGAAWARDHYGNRNAALFLAFAPDGRAIGLLSGTIVPRSILHHDSRVAVAGDAFVEPAWRRRGILRLLVREFEAWAVRMRATGAAAEHTADNRAAARAWRALGYEPESVRVGKRLR